MGLPEVRGSRKGAGSPEGRGQKRIKIRIRITIKKMRQTSES